MVTSLQRKLLRDLWRMRGQVFAIGAVVACGIASFVVMLSVHASLVSAAASYYENNRFPDVFAKVAYAPTQLIAELESLDGVQRAEGRIVERVSIDVEALAEPAIGRLVSLPKAEHGSFNLLHLTRGRMPRRGRHTEAVVSEAFAVAHTVALGDELRTLIKGHEVPLRVVGIALSPEYVYSIGEGSLFPDPLRFGVFWIEQDRLATLVDMEGGLNDITLSLARGASERDVIAAVDSTIERYGGRGAHGRRKQVSARYVDEELKQLGGMGAAVPVMFLAVAAFLLNVVMTRLVEGQREQIAALKALGYGNLALGIHYTEMMTVIVLGGTVLGAALGGLLGDGLIAVYGEYFRFPDLRFHTRMELLASATALSLGAGFVGTVMAIRRAVSLPPAEAMRPKAPATYKRGVLSRIGLENILGRTGRIVLRNIERSPGRTLMSSVGIAIGMAIMIPGTFSVGALDYVMEINFQRAQRDDATVVFTRAVGTRVLHELEAMDGVLRAEPMRNVAVRLRSGHRFYETGLQGLPQDGELRQLLDGELHRVEVPESGILLTDELGRRLGVHVGDALRVEILEGEVRTENVVVAGLVDELVGLNAYADVRTVNALMGEGRLVSGARLLLDPAKEEGVYLRLKRSPGVAIVSLRTAAYEVFMQTSGGMQNATAVILGFLAAVVTVGVVYNGARVVLAERSRELASLRVLGFTRGEVSTILLGELAVQLVLAIPLGCLLGYALALSVVSGIDTELYRFPLIISPGTYVLASAVALVSGTGAALLVRRRINNLDMVGVLKTRE